MNDRSLSRKLSTSVVDALKAHGHILVVKGGATALARELDELMAPEVATIEPRLKPHEPLVGEPTSTFGDETIDQAVEDMVAKLTHALMNSDHVEDVFAEDAVIRRDIFRVVRDGLRERPEEARDEDADQTNVTVKLEALGYVAATASRRADPSTLRQALERAASAVGARFSGFSAELREATFRLEGGGDDERLELEEAVADELTDLVEQGIVELPTVERRIDLGRAVPPAEQKTLRARMEAAAQATLPRSGCAAAWEMADARTVRVLFTPLSEHDARGVDGPTSAFAREIAALLVPTAEAKANHVAARGDRAAAAGISAMVAPERPASSASSRAKAAKAPKPEPSGAQAEEAPPSAPAAAKRKAKKKDAEAEAAKPSSRAAASSKTGAATKRATKAKEEPPKAATKKTAAKKATTKKAAEAPAPASRSAKGTAAKKTKTSKK